MYQRRGLAGGEGDFWFNLKFKVLPISLEYLKDSHYIQHSSLPLCREGGYIGVLITLVPKVLLISLEYLKGSHYIQHSSLPLYREGGDIGVLITLVPKVSLP